MESFSSHGAVAIGLLFTLFYNTGATGTTPTPASIPPAVAPYIAGVPSLVTPDPVYATSKPRPLVYGAPRFSSYRDFALEYGIQEDGTADPVILGEDLWVYFTTSDYDVRTHINAMFDDGFQGMVPYAPETKYFESLYGFVDCFIDERLCGTGFDSLFLSHGDDGDGREVEEEVVVEAPGMMHITYQGPMIEYEDGKWRCGVAYHYFKLPLREKGWQRNLKIRLDGKEGPEVIVPAFPEAREQVRNVLFGKYADVKTSGLWGEDSEWKVVVLPTLEGGVRVRRVKA